MGDLILNKSSTKIAILIPIYNGISYTQKCLKTLYESIATLSGNNYQIEVIIIDDGSKDGSAEWITLNYPSVYIVHGDGNQWWSGSINLGIEYASKNLGATHFLLFNNDNQIKEDYIQNIIEILEQVNSDTIIVSKVYDLSNPQKVFSMGGKFNSLFGTGYVINEKYKRKYDLNKIIEVDWSGGMGVLIPKSVFKKVGLFDAEKFPQYKGDFDFFLRAKNNGVRLIAFPNLKIWNDTLQTGYNAHNFRALIKSFQDSKSQMNFKENIRFYRRHAFFLIGYYGLFCRYSKYIIKTIIRASSWHLQNILQRW